MEMQLILLQNGYLIPPTHWEAAALAEFPCLLRMAHHFLLQMLFVMMAVCI
jgi:hypothetical protein